MNKKERILNSSVPSGTEKFEETDQIKTQLVTADGTEIKTLEDLEKTKGDKTVVLDMPVTKMVPTKAKEMVKQIIEIFNAERDGTLSSEQVEKILASITSGNEEKNAEKIEKVVIHPKQDRDMIENELPDALLKERESYDPTGLVDELRSAMKRVSRQVIGREELLIQTIYALLTREHQLIYSRAGMAKSLYAMAVFGQFEGARTFSIQLTKGTTEEGLVGAVDIDQLKKGNIVHNVKGSLVESRFAFLDEIFDANDVALRSLLGILNERLFRKGKQYVEAVLHSAIATSNYVRASEITEAVIDRFPFRAYLMPDADPYNLLRIDEVYGRNVGKVMIAEKDKKIPFEHIEYLADIIEGRVAGKEIVAPAHVLFLKNAVILEYMKLINDERKAKKKEEIYVSPRTMAKTRDILNASALLRGRDQLTTQDLADLKYMVTTIGDQDKQEEYFERALNNVLAGLNKDDLVQVDMFMEAHSLFESLMNARERGEKIQLGLWERIKSFLGITSSGELTIEKIQAAVNKFQSQNGLVTQLKSSLIKRLQLEADRLGGVKKSILD